MTNSEIGDPAVSFPVTVPSRFKPSNLKTYLRRQVLVDDVGGLPNWWRLHFRLFLVVLVQLFLAEEPHWIHEFL
jgi:hypothetical protein